MGVGTAGDAEVPLSGVAQAMVLKVFLAELVSSLARLDVVASLELRTEVFTVKGRVSLMQRGFLDGYFNEQMQVETRSVMIPVPAHPPVFSDISRPGPSPTEHPARRGRPAEAARSQAERGPERPGHAAQERGGERRRGALGRGPGRPVEGREDFKRDFKGSEA